MIVHELHLRPCRQVAGIARRHAAIPGIRKPLAGHVANAGDDQVVMRCLSEWLGLQLPYECAVSVPAMEALREFVQIALPHPRISRPLARIRQGDKQHAFDHLIFRYGTERLLQPGARAARELSDAAAAAWWWTLEGARCASTQFRAGAAGGRRQRGARGCGEVWTVDKPNARFGAHGRIPQNQRAPSCSLAWSVMLLPASGQLNSLPSIAIRGPPLLRGRPSR